MKSLIVPVVIIIGLIALFVIFDRKEFSLHDQVSTMRSENFEFPSEPVLNSPAKAEFVADANTITEAKVPPNTFFVKPKPEERPSETNEGINHKNESVNNNSPDNIKENPVPVAIPVATQEEAKEANEKAVKLFDDRIKKSFSGKNIMGTKLFLLVALVFISAGILFVARKKRILFVSRKKPFILLKGNYKTIVNVLLTLLLSCLLFLMIKDYLPCSKEIVLSYAIMNRIGETRLQEKDIKDTRIYYATKEDPVLSERQTIKKEILLPGNEDLFKHELTAVLPDDCIKVRIDLTYDAATIVNTKDDEYPEIYLRINGKQISKDGYRIDRKKSSSRVSFPVTITEDVLHSAPRTLHSDLFSIFFIILVIVSIAIKILDSQKRLQFVFLFFFFLLSLFPIVRFNLEKESKQENRTLERFPTSFYFDKASNCFSQFELWFNDRFFGREQLIAISDKVMNVFDDDRGSERAVKGEDDWMFFIDALPESKIKKVFSEDKMEKAGEYLDSINSYAKSKGIKFIFVICPDKYKIYGDKARFYLSDLYKKNDTMDQFVEYLRSHYDFPVIYQRKELLAIREESAHDLYFKYDTHWTQEGAYFGYYLPVVDALSIDPINVEKWEEKSSQSGDLINMLTNDKAKIANIPPQKYFCASYPKKASIEEIDDPANNTRKMIIASNPTGVKHVLFYRDSFSSAAVDLFANTFLETIFLWRSPIQENDLEYMNKSDIIVFEKVERNVIDLSDLTPFDIGE